MMLTTDLALKVDPAYREIYAADDAQEEFVRHFVDAWVR